jgi:hypothetical protein
MKSRILFGYQVLTGLSDTATGMLLIFSPAFTLQLMRLSVPSCSLPFLSYMGVFVLSVGIACLYGAYLTTRTSFAQKLEVVWLLTAITRGLVAVFIFWKLLSGVLEAGWMTVAVSDGALALIQSMGLSRDWLDDVAG